MRGVVRRAKPPTRRLVMFALAGCVSLGLLCSLSCAQQEGEKRERCEGKEGGAATSAIHGAFLLERSKTVHFVRHAEGHHNVAAKNDSCCSWLIAGCPVCLPSAPEVAPVVACTSHPTCHASLNLDLIGACTRQACPRQSAVRGCLKPAVVLRCQTFAARRGAMRRIVPILLMCDDSLEVAERSAEDKRPRGLLARHRLSSHPHVANNVFFSQNFSSRLLSSALFCSLLHSSSLLLLSSFSPPSSLYITASFLRISSTSVRISFPHCAVTLWSGKHPCDSRRPVHELIQDFPHVRFSSSSSLNIHKLRTDQVNFTLIPAGDDPHLCRPENCPPREPDADVDVRVKRFLEFLASRPEKEILVVSHSSFLARMFEVQSSSSDLSGASDVLFSNPRSTSSGRSGMGKQDSRMQSCAALLSLSDDCLSTRRKMILLDLNSKLEWQKRTSP
eukprot:755867-Hanusia_phi.AAC.1